MKTAYFRIHEEDNVAIALEQLEPGCEIQFTGGCCTAAEVIPRGHKVALSDLEPGQDVIKYGYPIGHATKRVRAGSWVHSHNMCTNLEGTLEYEYRPSYSVRAGEQGAPGAVAPAGMPGAAAPEGTAGAVAPAGTPGAAAPAGMSGAVAPAGTGALARLSSAPSGPTFKGYRRKNGAVGVRNEIWIIPTVSCANHTADVLAKLASVEFGDACDGIFAFPHNSGCSQLGDDHRMTQKLLAAIAKHPNAGGVLLVSLGCENNNIHEFLPVLGDYDRDRFRVLVTQEAGDEIGTGLELLRELAEIVKRDKRVRVPVSELKIAFKCGGSDSLSGVTANPLCGTVADRITSLGGSAVLTEVPEMFGAETILMNRADSRETFEKVVNLINSFKQYYLDYGQPVYENPSPGNKEGGITTLEEKSLGCVQKGGRAVVSDTLDYGEPVLRPGLNLMTGPGNDNVSITDLVASGAQILLFTTGRGNPLGTAIPCIKLSSNTALYERKRHWIDFNAGTIVDGDSLEKLSEKLWKLVLEVASGKKTRSEINGFREIMLFKNGVLL